MSRTSLLIARNRVWLGLCLLVSGMLMSWASWTSPAGGNAYMLFWAPMTWGAWTTWKYSSMLVRNGFGHVLVGLRPVAIEDPAERE